MGYKWYDERTWGPPPENRWYHFAAVLLAGVAFGVLAAALFGMPAREAMVMACFIMAWLCTCGFLAEATIMGLTAKAGGMFCTAAVCALVCKLAA